MDESDLYYAAGFFDGEGAIYYTRQHNSTGTANVYLTVSIANTNEPIIDWWAKVFGGVSSLARETRPGRKPIFRARWQSAAAIPVLRALAPYLRQKKEQADEALAFEATRTVVKGPRPLLSPEESTRRFTFQESFRRRFGRPAK